MIFKYVNVLYVYLRQIWPRHKQGICQNIAKYCGKLEQNNSMKMEQNTTDKLKEQKSIKQIKDKTLKHTPETESSTNWTNLYCNQKRVG